MNIIWSKKANGCILIEKKISVSPKYVTSKSRKVKMPYKDREQQLEYFRRRNFACKEELAAKRHQKYIEKHPTPKIVEHHIKYKEIHGVDETTFITAGEHKKLHNRLRREGKCKVPTDVLAKITAKAQGRTEKRREYLKNNKIKQKNKEYHSKNYNGFFFTETVDKNIRLIETIQINELTGTITINSFFRGDHNRDTIEVIL